MGLTVEVSIPPLHIGLIVDSWPPTVWQSRLYHKLARLGTVSLLTHQERPAGPWLWSQLAGRVPALTRSDDCLKVEHVSGMEAALGWCQRAEMDLVIDGTASRPLGMEPPSFRLGLWSLRQNDGRAVGANYAYLDEIARPEPQPSINLVRDDTSVLISAYPQVKRGHYLTALDRLLDIAASLPVQALSTRGPGQPWLPQPTRPANPVKALVRAARLMLWDRWRNLTSSEAWVIGLIDKPIEAVHAADLNSEVHWIGPWDNRRYWADPFGIAGDATRILCEEVHHDHPTGILKELTLGTSLQVVAERQLEVGLAGHLSYPFIFVSDGESYCVPESIAAGRVVIHRAGAAGTEWRPYCLALDGVRAADPTLFVHGGLFWMAYSDYGMGSEDTLCLAWANSIAGPWRQHRLNPVKIDVRSARPAGTPFVRNGMLLRPAQDCSRTYGGAIAINRIDVCTPDAFTEETVEVLRPQPASPASHGLHTLSAWGNRTLIDGKREWINPWVVRHKIRRKLGLVAA
ncbi:MAG: hypothetical protein P4L90_19230 [Rhodopila sp.]|nr:hypothetical protein [Rhodopila sp.]